MRTLIALVATVLTGSLARPVRADRAPAGSAPRADPAGAPTAAPPSRNAAPAEPTSDVPRDTAPVEPASRPATPVEPTRAPRAATPSPAAPAPRAGGPTAATPLLPSIDAATVPGPCQRLVQPAQVGSVAGALSARITLANCMADHATAPITLCDCAASVVAIDTAVAPALAVLDDVVDAGDPATQVLAEHAEGQLYTGFVHRLVATLPRISPEPSDAEIALADMRRQALDAQLAPWREAALTEFQHAVEIARAHPELAKNPVVASAVRDAEQRLASDVAAR